jgi:hypothetical protein
MRKPAGDRTGEPPPLGDSLEFFLMSQSAIDTARVNRDAKALCDSIGQLRTGDSPLGCPDLRHKLHQLGGQLVPGSWPPFLWQQAGEASFLKRCLRLIERRTREAERFCCLADRFLVDLHLTQHLVFDLQQIFRIEEFGVPKVLVPNVPGTRIQRALLAQEGSLGLPWVGHVLL